MKFSVKITEVSYRNVLIVLAKYLTAKYLKIVLRYKYLSTWLKKYLSTST